jgi:hypothetical protein
MLSFKVRALDDFGIKNIGIDWLGVDSSIVSARAKGERILSSGGPDKDSLEISGTPAATGFFRRPTPSTS